MTEIERKQKIYQEWIEEAQRRDPRKRQNEISSRDFAKSAGIGRDLATMILEEKAKNGEATKRETTRGAFYTLV